jgi:hypothetical protein
VLHAALHDYCDTSLRQMSGLDIVVAFADRHRAIALMLEHGFEPFPPQRT